MVNNQAFANLKLRPGSLNIDWIFHFHFLSRDRLVVRTLRCGVWQNRSNPGSNPGHGTNYLTIQFVFLFKNIPQQ